MLKLLRHSVVRPRDSEHSVASQRNLGRRDAEGDLVNSVQTRSVRDLGSREAFTLIHAWPAGFLEDLQRSRSFGVFY
jgi:hypothetical protein